MKDLNNLWLNYWNRWKIFNELLVQQLGGNDSYNRHVFSFA
jgi:hypothetical protein